MTGVQTCVFRSAFIEEYIPDHQITELPHGIVDGTMLEIAAVASRANELVLAGQRDELADDKGNATSSPLQYDGRDGKSLRSILQHAEIVGLEGYDHDHAEAVHQERIVPSFPQFVHGTKEIRLRFRPVGVHEPHGIDEEKIGTT